MDEKKKKEFIKLGTEFKVGILKGLIESGERCICEEGEDCSINKALDFLKKHPDVPVEELAEVITSFELSLLEAQGDLAYVVHAFPLEILENQEEAETKRTYEEQGLKKDEELILEDIERVERAGGCDCNSKYCFHSKALDLRKVHGISLEKIAGFVALVENNAREKFEENPIFKKPSDEWDN